MARFAILLRGVNVGKGKRVPMAEFRRILEALGYREVRTLLNSGNAVGESGARSSAKLAAPVRAALLETLQVDTPVIVKSAQEFAAIEAGNPFARDGVDPSRLLVAFTPDAASLQGLLPVAPLARAPERFAVGEHAAYLACPNGILESEAAKALLGKAGRAATTRNWATVTKIGALLRRA